MELDQVKALTGRTYGVGIHRVVINDPEKAKQALTRDDIRNLVKKGVITIKKIRGTSRVRARIIHEKIKKGRRRGMGSRRGGRYGSLSEKDIWMMKVRAQRAYIRQLKEKKSIDARTYRQLYRMIKGNAFKSKNQMRDYLKERGLLHEKAEETTR